MTAAQRADGARPRAASDATREWGTRDLSVRFGKRTALDHVTLRAAPGQIGAVVGGDGAGKSTLLGCVAGAVAASQGEVDRPPAARVGYLPSGSGVYPDLTVAENLAFRASVYGVSSAVAGQRVTGLLERTGLASARQRLAGQLSGGMRKKLGVIAAMVHEPELLVLDEPTTGVDPVSRADVWWLIIIAASEGAAVIVSTSYLDEAERTAAVLVLSHGRQLAAGTPAQIKAGVPGILRAISGRPREDERQRAWLRAGQWRVWDPPGASASGPGPDSASRDSASRDSASPDSASPDSAGRDSGSVIQPDLEDAVTVAELGSDLRQADRGEGAGPGPAGGAR
jgi:ABC-2 type transport system ATP-binding protein